MLTRKLDLRTKKDSTTGKKNASDMENNRYNDEHQTK
jgi:hypothetical protein